MYFGVVLHFFYLSSHFSSNFEANIFIKFFKLYFIPSILHLSLGIQLHLYEATWFNSYTNAICLPIYLMCYFWIYIY